MIVASFYAIAMLDLAKLSVPQLLLSAALLNAAVALYIYGLMPEFLLRSCRGCWSTRSTGSVPAGPRIFQSGAPR